MYRHPADVRARGEVDESERLELHYQGTSSLTINHHVSDVGRCRRRPSCGRRLRAMLRRLLLLLLVVMMVVG